MRVFMARKAGNFQDNEGPIEGLLGLNTQTMEDSVNDK